ncbi:NADH dehydrogenase [ubiquinone] 1 alpha subcomplex assembly factor 2 isoform X4 [Paramormyrops kingsleyae]|uniref:NADH dehydrogenase [ubiquinone] 1 alpha subcomplex assembly factor 2 isoform X4 n=1 Tax=Paramormyrops kingsleyae TaxID=1676925 RepID=UPI000CD5D6E8|nr:NADH dehydrogenase [ubiquinone] 1 alpha subcomplex assembly factor 2 isoform X5 [Paramormyrops kingsleyae]
MSKISSLLRRTFGIVKEHVGTDHFGNKYYSIPEQRTWMAWIRGRRKDPPTIEELERNQLYREQIKQKAREVEDRDSTLQAQEHAEGLVARPMQTLIEGHASAKHFRQTRPSEDPISTGNTFEPGSWAPNKGTTSKK